MTIEEMHINIKADLDHINAELVEDFQPEEIDQQINSTIKEYIDNVITIKEYKLINTLVKPFQYDGNSSIISGQNYKIDLPSDYYDFINGYLTIKSNHYSNDTDTYIKVPYYLITPNFQDYLTQDPFENSDTLGWLAEIRDNSIYIDWDEKSIVNKIYLKYIKKPATVSLSSSIDCDLPINVHQKIVDYTTQRIINVIKNRQQ